VLPLLEGVRVIEVGAVVLGPYAGQILADLGAEVIKVEPLEGDIARHAHPQGPGGGALFVNNNRNKRMLALDLKKPEGRAALARLVEGADVLFHNMRLDASERLGLGYEQVVAINPNIVHCAATGFGRGGQYRDRPAFDDIIQAASGLAGLAALQNGTPAFAPTIVADKVAALHVVYGIVSALFARERGRPGPFRVEVPMFEAMVAFLMNEHLSGATFANNGVPGYPRLLSPDRRPFRTADGWIAVLPYTEPQWRRFLGAIGRAEVCEEGWFQSPAERQAHIGTLYAIVAASLEARGTDAWIEALEAIDIPCSRVPMPLELLDDPHLREIGFFDVPEGFPVARMIPQPVQFTGIPQTPDTPPHALGEDSRAVLLGCGYDDTEIDALVAAGIVAV